MSTNLVAKLAVEFSGTSIWRDEAMRAIKVHGYEKARFIYTRSRDNSTMGTASHSFANAMVKEIEAACRQDSEKHGA
jgi:hypothetical protein